MILSWILRFVLFLLAFFLLRRLFSVFFKGNSLGGARNTRKDFSRNRRNEIQGETVKDPFCGTYVAKSIAVQEESRLGTLYFCSERCRQEYLKKSGI